MCKLEIGFVSTAASIGWHYSRCLNDQTWCYGHSGPGTARKKSKVIVFERGGHTVQRLDVSSMTPLAQDESFFFGGQDINFDGWLDLLLITQKGSTNAKAEYWLYDPAADRFRDLGEFPMFRVDALHYRLSTYVSNGPAGLDFEKRDYAFKGNYLVVMSEETRKPSSSRPGWYVHTVRRLENGKLVVVLRQTVKQPP